MSTLIRKMRLIYPSLLLVCMASCSRYQYLTINSHEIHKNDKQEFVFENDTLQLTYNFNGQNAPLNLTIKNKLEKPIYIDWKRSALIINDKAVSYSPDEVKIYSVSHGNSIDWSNGFTSTISHTTSTAQLPATVQLIPPQSYISGKPMGVTNQLFDHLPGGTFQNSTVQLSDGSSGKIKKAAFEPDNSPLRFRNYLTIQVGDPANQSVACIHAFYVSEILRSSSGPRNYAFTYEKAGDRSYVQRETGFGKGVAGVGVLAGLALIAGVNAQAGK